MEAPFSRTLANLIFEQAERYGSRPAVIWQDQVISYSELCERASRVAASLRARGVVRGDRVGLLINNRPEWLEAFFGTMIAGGVVVAFSTWSTADELDWLLQDSGASTLIALDRFGDNDCAAALRRLVPEAGTRDNHLDAVWIAGVGHATETYWMGDRMGNNPTAEHADAYALGRSFEKSYRMAGITDPARQVHVAELYAPFSNTEFHSIDAARLVSRPGESVARLRDGEFDIGGRIPVNPSGGTLCTNAIAVTAMARVAEVALQVWGRAGDHQVKGARLGIASGNGGDHQIFGTMVIGA